MKNSAPLISVIIPVFGVEDYICECLKSVKAQTYSRFECIIVDDCGNDKSIEYAEKLIGEWNGDKRFRIIRRSQNGGLSAARNSGIDSAKGEYIYFLDGDDKIFPQALEKLISIATKYEGVEFVQGNVVSENKKGVCQFAKGEFPEFSNDREWIRQQMLQLRIAISAWNKLYKSEYLKTNNLKFIEGIIHEDVKWLWDNQKVVTSMAFCDYYCYWYRTGSQNSIMHCVDKTRSAISYLMIYQMISGEISDKMEVGLVKDYILSYKISLKRWAYSRKRNQIRKKLRELVHQKAPMPLVRRCILLNILSYTLPSSFLKVLDRIYLTIRQFVRKRAV